MVSKKRLFPEKVEVYLKQSDDWKRNGLENNQNDYQPDDIFNADEMRLFYECLTNKTLTFKDNACHGGKNSKDRITVMVGTHMSGKEKLW